jgi:hypothetical protein
MTTPQTPDELAASVLAAQQAAGSGLGETAVDPRVLLAAIQQMQERVAVLEAEKAQQHAPALLAAAQSLADQLAGHSHQPLVNATAELVDAAANAVKSGDVTFVKKIAADIAELLHRNHPGPGDNHVHRQALDWAEVHVPDAADRLPPPSRPVLAGTGGPATQVITGHVTG